MNSFERYCIRLGHHPIFENLPWLGALRPIYNTLLGVIASKKGLERTINGTDSIRIHPKWRGVQEGYESLVWEHFMSNVQEGDFVVDVGAFIGLYTIASAKRVGPNGSIVAFEPEPTNFKWLQQHITLNHVEDRVKPIRKAVNHQIGESYFIGGRDSQSHIGKSQVTGLKVCVTTLDVEFPSQRIDLLKIDVEGFEEKVLCGGIRLLQDASRCPRLIYIEIHPYAWEETRTTSESLLSLLRECGYDVSRMDGGPVRSLESYCEIVAHKNPDRHRDLAALR